MAVKLSSFRYGPSPGKAAPAFANPFGSTRASIQRGSGGGTKRRKARPKKQR